MKYSQVALMITACLLPLLSSGASAQATRSYEPDLSDAAVRRTAGRAVWRTTSAGVMKRLSGGGIATTQHNQILVELAPGDTTAANRLDLNGRTLVFTANGRGGYSRQVRSLAWEDDVGEPVADGVVIELESFGFDFAGKRWHSFHVSRRGLVTFGEPFTYSYEKGGNRFSTLREIVANFVTTPTISPLYKPRLGGLSDEYGATQHVSRRQDRVVVTWKTTEPQFYVQGVAPRKPSSFQVVLGADGSVRFSYRDVSLGDGIVGLFPDEEARTEHLIASIADPRNPELPGHMDLLNAAIYESNTDGLIVEWTTRGRISMPPSGTRYSYRFHLDTDEPYFDGRDEDIDFVWQVDIESDATHVRGRERLPTDADNKIALLVDGDGRGLSARVRASAVQFDNGRGVAYDGSRLIQVELPRAAPSIDLSRQDRTFSARQSEVFHYRGPPDTAAIACRVVDTLGDKFDLFVFHIEFRVDSQKSGSPWRRYGANTSVAGVGDIGREVPPCRARRLKGHWKTPVWMKSRDIIHAGLPENARFDPGLLLFDTN